MTAAEAIIRAREAGLTLAADPRGLAVGGPKAARADLLPALRPLANEILALITRPLPCVSGPSPCPACGYIHGTLGPRPACADCGATDRTIMLVVADVGRRCARCLEGASGLTETNLA